jgi:hypothetical protein
MCLVQRLPGVAGGEAARTGSHSSGVERRIHTAPIRSPPTMPSCKTSRLQQCMPPLVKLYLSTGACVPCNAAKGYYNKERRGRQGLNPNPFVIVPLDAASYTSPPMSLQGITSTHLYNGCLHIEPPLL